MKEIWKKIEGFENYEVSNFGRIKSLQRWINNGRGNYLKKEFILKNKLGTNKYEFVLLSRKKGLGIHRLVAQAFIPNPENKEQVNHKDFDRTNNRVDNLEWVSRKENMNHAYKAGKFKGAINTNKGKKFTQEHKDKISKSNMGKHNFKPSEETRKKMSLKLMGNQRARKIKY